MTQMDMERINQLTLHEDEPNSPAVAIAAAALMLQGIAMLNLERSVLASILTGSRVHLLKPKYWTGGGYLDGASLEIGNQSIGGFRAGATKKIQGTYGVITYFLHGEQPEGNELAFGWCVPVNGDSWFRVAQTSLKPGEKLYKRLEKIGWKAKNGYVCKTVHNNLLVQGIMGASGNSSIEVKITRREG